MLTESDVDFVTSNLCSRSFKVTGRILTQTYFYL